MFVCIYNRVLHIWAVYVREITRHMGSHSGTWHPAVVIFLPLPQPKLVLNLATMEGCKAELTWVVVIFQSGLPAEIIGQCHGLELNLWPNTVRNTITNRPRSHPVLSFEGSWLDRLDIKQVKRDTPLKINPRIFLAGLKVYIIVTYLSQIARLSN